MDWILAVLRILSAFLFGVALSYWALSKCFKEAANAFVKAQKMYAEARQMYDNAREAGLRAEGTVLTETEEERRMLDR